MKIALAACLAVLILTGCGTSPIQVSDATPVPTSRIDAELSKPGADSAKVTVVRDSGLLGGGCLFGFYVDGKLIARLDTSERHSVELPAGEHVLGAAAVGRALCSGENRRREVATILKPGDSKVYRMSVEQGMGLTIQPSTMLGPK